MKISLPSNLLNWIACVLFTVDVIFSFAQYYNLALDGDMCGIIDPAPPYTSVLHDPFALNATVHHQQYAATNRYFAHATLRVYFNYVPNLLQSICSPINSVYVAVAIAKTTIHIMLVFMIATLSLISASHGSQWFWPIACMVSSFLQCHGYAVHMGAIDKSVTYAFFYAWPMVVQLFLIYYFLQKNNKKFYASTAIICCLLSVYIAFNGPLAPVILLLSSVLYVCYVFVEYRTNKFHFLQALINIWRQHKWAMITILFTSSIAIYSIYAGTFNAENQWTSLSLGDRYSKLPAGLFYILTGKAGYALLLSIIIYNIFLVRKKYFSWHILKVEFLLCGAAIIFLLLLPLGGYRDYREYIIRRDSFLPIIILLFFIAARSTYWLANFYVDKRWLVWPVCVMFIFFIVDLKLPKDNACERQMMAYIAQHNDSIVAVPYQCSLLSWKTIYDYGDTPHKAAMLRHWNICGNTYYYHSRP